MASAAGPQFGAQNKGYETYGFETENTDCVFIVNTEAVTPGATSFTIRTSGTCTYVVDWGDDSSETVTATTATHNYSTAGTYNVGIRVVSGTFRPYYNNNTDGDIITKFRGRSDFEFTGSLNGAFYGCGNLDEITADFSQVTDISNAFRDSPLVDFQNTGAGATVLNQNLFGFNDLSSVTSNTSAFYNCPSLKNIVGLDLSSTTNLSGVFAGTTNPVRFGTENLPIKLGTTAGDLSLSSLFSQKTNLREVHLDYGERISSFQSAFSQSGITTFSVGDNNLSNVTNMTSTFNQSGIRNFGTEANPITFRTSGSTFSLRSAFGQAYSLKEFHITSGAMIDSLFSTFNEATGITTFRIGDGKLSNVTNMTSAFRRCYALLSFGSEANPISFGSTGTNVSLYESFYEATALTDFFVVDSARISSLNNSVRSTRVVNFGTETTPIGIGSTADNSTLVDCGNMFNQSSYIREFHMDYGERISSLSNTFYSSGITTFRIGDNKLTNCTNMSGAFRQSKISSFGSEANPITFGSTGTNVSLYESFRDNTSLTDFFITDSARVNSFSYTFASTGLVNFGSSTTPVGLGSTADNSSTCTFANAFNGVSALRESHIDSGERISSLQSAFQSSGITTFSVGDNNLSNCTSMQNAFIYSSLTEFPGVNLVGCTSLYQAFQQGSLVKFGTQANPVGLGSTADNSSTCSLVQAFYAASSFKEFHVDSGDRISTLQNAFYNTGITTFSVGDNDLSNCTSLRSAFFATPLTEFSGFNLVGCTDFYKTFQSNTALVNFGTQANPIGLGTTGDNASTCTWPDTFYGVSTLKEVHIDSGTRVGDFSASFVNTGITTFRINDTNLSSVITMSNAFLNSALDTASIENILVSCDNGGKSSIALTLSGGTNAAKSTWTSTANTAYTNLIGKSWTITYNA
jgi:hypothetical protein